MRSLFREIGPCNSNSGNLPELRLRFIPDTRRDDTLHDLPETQKETNFKLGEITESLFRTLKAYFWHADAEGYSSATE